MTDPPSLIIETQRPGDVEAAELERLTGCLVVRLAPTRGEPIWATDEDKAANSARKLMKQEPGSLYAYFKPIRFYHAVYKEPNDATSIG